MLAFLLSLTCAFTLSAKSMEIVDVEGAEAAEKLNEKSVVVLDVRSPQEVAMGRIPGSININIADPDFAKQVAKLDPSKTYMVHYAAGSPGGRSRRSLEALQELGVEKVYHLDGGFNGWKQSGNEVEVPKQ